MKSNHLPATGVRRIGAAIVVATLAACAATLDIGAQQVGPNVSVVTGPDSELTGDPFLQRQNEAVLAISTRNPDHMMVAMNDYSTVDVAFDPTPEGGNEGLMSRNSRMPGTLAPREIRANASPEAWIGLAFSQNRGQHWYKALLPGFPQDTSPVGTSSPLFGLTAGTDPVLVAGPHGRFYLGGLAFDRDGTSRIFVARFTDKNAEEGGETIHYDLARVVHRGSQSSRGRFADKPSIGIYAGSAGTFSASGSSKKGPKEKTVVLAGCERVYIAYTMFEGLEADGKFRSAVYVSYSASCGQDWSSPVKVNGPYSVGGTNFPGTRNQGTSIAIDPATGHVYIVWRVFGPNGFVVVRSTNGGVSYSTPQLITGSSPVFAFDQPTVMTTQGPPTFRTNAYPSAVLDNGKLTVVWQERVGVNPSVSSTFGQPLATGEPRIVITQGTVNLDGSIVWSPRRAADLGDVGLQSPNRRCEFESPTQVAAGTPACRDTGQQVMPHVAAGDGQLVVFYYEGRGTLDAFTGLISGIDRQVDVRVALLNPSTAALVNSVQVSRYTIDSATGEIVNAPDRLGPLGEALKKVNHLNAPMYRGGFAPFAGDYPHLIPLRPDGSGPGFRAVWTDNRDVIFPPAADFTVYSGPWTGELSTCNPGARDSNIYTAEIGTGLVVGSPGNFKQLVDENNTPVQRAFAVYVENHTAQHRSFRLQFQSVTSGVLASFEQLVPGVTTVDVEVLAGSSVTRSAYLTGTSLVRTGSAVVSVREIPLAGGDVLPNGLSASVTLNGDPTNPFVSGGADGNDLANTETHSPQLGSPQLGSPQLGSPQLGSPQLGSPQLGSPQVSSPQVSSTGEGDALAAGSSDPAADVDEGITDITFEVLNAGNTASGYNALVALLNAPQLATTDHTFQVLVYRTHQTPSMDNCKQMLRQQDRLLFMTPQLGSPQLGSPQLGSPQLGSPQLGSPQLGSPQLGSPQLGSPQLASTSFAAAPADPSPTDHDGTIHEHVKRDVIKLTLRIFHPVGEPPDAHTPAEFLDNVAVAVTAQAADTGEDEPETAGYKEELLGTSLVVTNTNDDGPGSLRAALSAANEEPGLDTIFFDIPGEGPHSIVPLTPLPAVSAPVVIDGMSQPGFSGTPLIELRGVGVEGGPGPGPGLRLQAGNSTVRGLAINGFSQAGIRINGLTEGAEGAAGSNVIVGNYVGTDVTGFQDRGNAGNGVHIIDSPSNLVGGTAAGARNVISGNNGEGVRIDGSFATGNVVEGNYIGTDAAGTGAIGNSASGVFIRRAPGNSVLANVVSGNLGFAGVAICGSIQGQPECGGGNVGTQTSDAAGNTVRGNLIGRNAKNSGPLPNGNYGVSIDGAPDNVIGGTQPGDPNLIAHNVSDGVVVFNAPASGNTIRRNSILQNGGLGIDLAPVGVTPNDNGGGEVPLPPDADQGANDLQNFPVLRSVVPDDGSTTVSGILRSTPSTTFAIDFYASPACDDGGNGEGAMFVGSASVSTDANGAADIDAELAFELAEGHVITATATDVAGNTSEFSPCAGAGEAAGDVGFLLFEVDPSNGTAGQSINAVQVEAFDNTESPLPGVSITISIANDACGTSTLSGQLVQITNEAGVATFPDLTIDRGSRGFTLRAAATSDPEVNEESDAFDLVGFCGTGGANASRALYAAARLGDESGRVLLTGGNDNEGNALSSAELYDPEAGEFTLTGAMSKERQEHTATLLLNGSILVVGGDARPSTAELFSPVTGEFTATGAPNDQHVGHTATLLDNGRVLVAGGASEVSAEVYDPVEGVFAPTAGNMIFIRPNHAATLLDDGRVLLTGGRDVTGENPNLALRSTEIYDPGSGEFVPGPNMINPRMDHAAVRLPDGRVLITGGLLNTTSATATAEIYDPVSNAFALVDGNMGSDRASHTATLLEDETILIAGGFSTVNPGPLATAEIYDPVSGSFATTGGLVTERHSHAALPLFDGTILLVGGWGVTEAELFYPAPPPIR